MGATVQLVEPTDQWQLLFKSEHHVMHLAVNEGEEYTMLDARVTGLSADGRIMTLGAFTLALGARTKPRTLAGGEVLDGEPHGVFGESGINVSYPFTDGVFIRLRYRKPLAARSRWTPASSRLLRSATPQECLGAAVATGFGADSLGRRIQGPRGPRRGFVAM